MTGFVGYELRRDTNQMSTRTIAAHIAQPPRRARPSFTDRRP